MSPRHPDQPPRHPDQRCSALEPPRLLRVGFAAASAARCNAVALCCPDREAHISFVLSVFFCNRRLPYSHGIINRTSFRNKQNENKLENKNLDQQMASAAATVPLVSLLASHCGPAESSDRVDVGTASLFRVMFCDHCYVPAARTRSADVPKGRSQIILAGASLSRFHWQSFPVHK